MVQLVKYETARKALAEARRVDEAKAIRDKAEALAAYARQVRDEEMRRWVLEIKYRAERRIGELSRGLDKGAGPGRGKTIREATKSFKADALKTAGISKDQASKCEAIAAIPEQAFNDAMSTDKLLAQSTDKLAALGRRLDEGLKAKHEAKKQAAAQPIAQWKAFISACREFERAISQTVVNGVRIACPHTHRELVYGRARGIIIKLNQLQDSLGDQT